MTDNATFAAILWIKETATQELGITIKEYYGKSDIIGDKKHSDVGSLLGRGIHAMAEADIPANILNDVLKIDGQKLIDHWKLGKQFKDRGGQSTKHINVANLLTAMFIATGQDVASVAESHTASFDMEPSKVHPGGVHFSMSLPSLAIGTVGGGTGLPTQRECLEMMGCFGTGKVRRLAEIIAGFCLALDISTYSSIHAAQSALCYARDRPKTEKKSHVSTPL